MPGSFGPCRYPSCKSLNASARFFMVSMRSVQSRTAAARSGLALPDQG